MWYNAISRWIYHLVILYQLAEAALTIGIRPRKVASELLLPSNSTTALMCEPVFSGDISKATWFRNGVKIAEVSSDFNAIYEDRPHVTEQPMPNVGFLIIGNIQKSNILFTTKEICLPVIILKLAQQKVSEDEGEYWCRKETGEAGEIFKLRVAYVDQIEPGKVITVEPLKPSLGAPLLANCPVPEAFPRPTISWVRLLKRYITFLKHLDGEAISATSSDSIIFANGSLFLPRLTTLQLGRLECICSNFAGKSSTHIQLHAARVSTDNFSNSTSRQCGVIFHSSVLWFLLGCLVTSSAVLLYLLCVLVLLRPNQSRLTLRPSMWLRSHPLLGPGFRKAIVPTPDYLVPPHQVQNV